MAMIVFNRCSVNLRFGHWTCILVLSVVAWPLFLANRKLDA